MGSGHNHKKKPRLSARRKNVRRVARRRYLARRLAKEQENDDRKIVIEECKLFERPISNDEIPEIKRRAEVLANGGQPPAKLPRTEEAGTSSQEPLSEAGPSGLSLPLPIQCTETDDQFVCKVEQEDYDEGSSTTTAVLNPASRLTHEPARLPDGTLMVPLPVMEHMPIKQEIDGEDTKPLQPLYVELADADDPQFGKTSVPVVIHRQHEIKGHRIVDISYLLEWTMELSREHFKVCPETDLKLIDEIQDGLRSDLVFHCNKCGYDTVKSTMHPDTCPAVLREFYSWRNSLKRSTWLFVHKMLNIFSIPFKI